MICSFAERMLLFHAILFMYQSQLLLPISVYIFSSYLVGPIIHESVCVNGQFIWDSMHCLWQDKWSKVHNQIPVLQWSLIADVSTWLVRVPSPGCCYWILPTLITWYAPITYLLSRMFCPPFPFSLVLSWFLWKVIWFWFLVPFWEVYLLHLHNIHLILLPHLQILFYYFFYSSSLLTIFPPRISF